MAIKINHGSTANKLFIEFPSFQEFSLYSNTIQEYQAGSIHPKPQENTSGQEKLFEFGTTLPILVSWKVPGMISDLLLLKIHKGSQIEFEWKKKGSKF